MYYCFFVTIFAFIAYSLWPSARNTKVRVPKKKKKKNASMRVKLPKNKVYGHPPKNSTLLLF